MQSTWCKICGVTRAADVLQVEAAGADAIGFNCYPKSPRFLNIGALTDCVVEVKRAIKVALFVDPTRGQVEQVLSAVDFDLLQFHGDESAPFCESFGVPYMKALRMQASVDFTAWAHTYESAWALLIDAYVPGQPGGTGVKFDWHLWPKNASQRLVLAGGLTPDNVAEAVSALNPFGVDVSGGVEGAVKGHKILKKVDHFIQEVRRAEHRSE